MLRRYRLRSSCTNTIQFIVMPKLEIHLSGYVSTVLGGSRLIGDSGTTDAPSFFYVSAYLRKLSSASTTSLASFLGFSWVSSRVVFTLSVELAALPLLLPRVARATSAEHIRPHTPCGFTRMPG